MPTCIVCKGEYSKTDARCSKCGVDNRNWETERARSGVSKALLFFLESVWGWLALSSLGLPAVSIVLYDYIQLVASVRIGVPLAIILCFVIFLFTYALRFSAREYELLGPVRKGWQPTLALMALLAFNTALVMGVAVAFVLEAHLSEFPPTYTQGLTRALMTIFFSLTFVSVTLSAMLMSIRSFAKGLNELVPQPIFLRDDLLVDVVIKVAQKQLGGKTTLSLVEMSRTDGGGVKALVKDEVQEKQWELEADQWGRRLSIKRPKTW
jgi:hypothetical protein